MHGYAKRDDQEDVAAEGLFEYDAFKGYNTECIKSYDGKNNFIV